MELNVCYELCSAMFVACPAPCPALCLMFCPVLLSSAAIRICEETYAQVRCCLQKIDAEEAAIWEEMLSAANMVEEEAKQRYRKAKESKEVCLQFVATEMWSVTHDSAMATTRLWVSSLGLGFNIDLHNFLRTNKDVLITAEAAFVHNTVTRCVSSVHIFTVRSPRNSTPVSAVMMHVLSAKQTLYQSSCVLFMQAGPLGRCTQELKDRHW